MREERWDVWREIVALALCLGGLFFFVLGFLMLTGLIASWLLTGDVRVAGSQSEIALEVPQQALGVLMLILPGVALLLGAFYLRYFMRKNES